MRFGSKQCGAAFTLILAVVRPVCADSATTAPAASPVIASDVPISGRDNPALVSLDELMTTFIKQYHIPGAALAVTRHGRLVYARGRDGAEGRAIGVLPGTACLLPR